jgi:hypothetical protein
LDTTSNDLFDPVGVSTYHRDYENLNKLMTMQYGAILFLHKDADDDRETDGKGPKTRRAQIQKWIDDAKASGTALPPCIIVIPVQVTEAWLLVCEQTLRRWGRVPAGKSLPVLPKDVERQNKAKETLKAILEEIGGKPLGPNAFSREKYRLWEILRQTHDGFSVLGSVPAFRQLQNDIAQVVKQNGLASF